MLSARKSTSSKARRPWQCPVNFEIKALQLKIINLLILAEAVTFVFFFFCNGNGDDRTAMLRASGRFPVCGKGHDQKACGGSWHVSRPPRRCHRRDETSLSLLLSPSSCRPRVCVSTGRIIAIENARTTVAR